jgi:hypothetical protein
MTNFEIPSYLWGAADLYCYSCEYEPPRSLGEIDAEIRKGEAEILGVLKRVAG